MCRASILLPTHEHASTLPHALASVQAQGVDDMEILIVGDGVTDAVRAAIAQLQGSDRRIRFFDFPKGPRHGEVYRHTVLGEAQGESVYYQCDDDLWLPGHLEAMETALQDADFVGAMHTNVETDGKVRAYFFDLERSEFTAPWLCWKPNGFGAWASDGFGLQCAAHRLEAYRRLPEGWTTTPDGLPPSQAMWHKFLRQPWCRVKFLRYPVSLHFTDADRRDWTPERRAAELEHWAQVVAGPDGVERIWQHVLADLGDRLLQQSIHEIDERNRVSSAQTGLAARSE
jgi:hypothetical protein